MVVRSISASPSVTLTLPFTACISDINAWMWVGRLWLNPPKTQVIWLGSGQLLRQVSICHVPVLYTQAKPVESACDLGVIIDSQLSLSAHVTALCRSGYTQLRQLCLNIRSLTADAAKTLVQAFIMCRLNCCSSLLYGVSNYLLQKVHSRTWQCECITAVLQKLQWLPVRRSVEFKLACLVHQLLAGQTPSYLASDIQLTAHTGNPQLRSASERIFLVARTHSSFGDRSFFCCRPSGVERLAITSVAWHELQTFQACTERT